MTTLSEMLAALDVPQYDVVARTGKLTSFDALAYANDWFTTAMARECLTQWSAVPSGVVWDGVVMEQFRRFLVAGLKLGYRLNRFASTVIGMPEPRASARAWITPFEEALSADDCGTLRVFVEDEESAKRTAEPIRAVSEAVLLDLGLLVRPIEVRIDTTLQPGWYRFEWNDVSQPPRRVHEQDASDRDQKLQRWLLEGIRSVAPALVTRDLCDVYLNGSRSHSPDLVAAVEGAVDADVLVQILRGLVAENVSIVDLSSIFRHIVDLRVAMRIVPDQIVRPTAPGVYLNGRDASIVDLEPSDHVEYVRQRSSVRITFALSGGSNTINAYLVSFASPIDPVEAPPTHARKELVEKLRSAMASGRKPNGSAPPVVLTTSPLRRLVRDILASDFAGMPVVAYEELSEDTNILNLGKSIVVGQ